MPFKYLSPQSSQLKKARGLTQAHQRERYGQMLVEGIQAVRELLSCAPELVRDVYVTKQTLDAHSDIAQLLNRLDPYVHIGEAQVISSVAPSAQGMFAVARIPASPAIEDLTAHATLLVCCVEASDPGNVGTIIRTADAAGANGVFLGRGSVDPTSSKVIRSAAGSTFHIPVLMGDAEAAVVAARSAGMQILLADADGDVNLAHLQAQAYAAKFASTSSPNDAISLAKPTMWLVGNEARGFTAEQRAWADAVVSIPMWGSAESLNLSVATSLCLYASAMQLYAVPAWSDKRAE